MNWFQFIFWSRNERVDWRLTSMGVWGRWCREAENRSAKLWNFLIIWILLSMEKSKFCMLEIFWILIIKFLTWILNIYDFDIFENSKKTILWKVFEHFFKSKEIKILKFSILYKNSFEKIYRFWWLFWHFFYLLVNLNKFWV